VVSQVQAPQRYGTEKTRVLVAEPNTQRRKQYFRNLSDWGYEVIFARDGVEALTLLFYHWPDIVILTMGLKKLDTKDVTGIIKKDPAASRIPVLLAAEKTETLEKSLNASVADGSLALPFLHEVFKTSVATARKLKTVSAPKKAA
jgi:CheY-like chemotaxis protein